MLIITRENIQALCELAEFLSKNYEYVLVFSKYFLFANNILTLNTYE